MPVKLSSRLPKPELSGLDLLTSSLLKYPGRYRLVVGLVDCSRVTVEHTEKMDVWTPTARLVVVEPVTDRDAVNDVLNSMVQAHRDRLRDGMDVAADTGQFEQMVDLVRTDVLDDSVWAATSPLDDDPDGDE